MKAEIISVGTELLLGQVVNSDTAFVAQRLASLGFDVQYSSIVGDNSGRLTGALQEALVRADLVVTTGGLGPTGDDLTKETCAELAGRPLKMHEESLNRLTEHFKGRVLSESQLKQAMLPEGATALPNDFGTAPGCGFTTQEGKIIVMFPGPPKELVPMLDRYAIPYLAQWAGGVIHSQNVRVFGVGEGSAAELIADLTESANPTAATYAGAGEMYVRVTAKAATVEEAKKLCGPMVEAVRERIGDSVYGVDVESLEEVVVTALKDQGLTLATAESCTGGYLSKRLTDIPGASQVFHMGAVTYANDIKTKLLGVPEAVLAEKGAVSREVAAAMAEGVRREAGADLGIGITGVAGPDGGTEEKPVGLIFIGLCNGETTWVREVAPRFTYRKEREPLRLSAANNALDMLRRYLLKLPDLEMPAFQRDRERQAAKLKK